jgi:hypothetical protein
MLTCDYAACGVEFERTPSTAPSVDRDAGQTPVKRRRAVPSTLVGGPM